MNLDVKAPGPSGPADYTPIAVEKGRQASFRGGMRRQSPLSDPALEVRNMTGPLPHLIFDYIRQQASGANSVAQAWARPPVASAAAERQTLMQATCSQNVGCPAEEFDRFGDAHRDRQVVVCANTSAAVKAGADWMVTSSCALAIVAHPKTQGQKILWAPGRHLARNIQEQTGADMLLWDVARIVHDEFKGVELESLHRAHRCARVLVHPESPASVVAIANAVGSTSALLNAVVEGNAASYIVATDSGPSLVATQVGSLAERQLDLMVLPNRNGGLAPILSVHPDHEHGVQVVATSVVVAMRRTAAPSGMQSIPKNPHNQDIVPFSTQAATALAVVRLIDALAQVVKPIDPDRPLDDDIRRAADMMDLLQDEFA